MTRDESDVCIVRRRRYAELVTVIRWNGDDLPEEMRSLPPGTYVLQRADELTSLTPEEEQGLVEALESLRAGRGLEHEAVRARVLRHLP
jgi:hypothetical protein